MKVIRTQTKHAEILANYFAVNEAHFKPWSPAVPKGHHTVDAWHRRLQDRQDEFDRGESVHFIGTDITESHVIGSCSLSNIIRGVFMACHMGYSVAERYEGQGYARKIVSCAIDYAFKDLKLHRIMANHMPQNDRSAALLKSLGFKREGYAQSYLLIDGRWEDHVLNSLINPRQK